MMILLALLKAIGIGLAFFIIPFGLLMLSYMTPWFIMTVSIKFPFVRQIFIKKFGDRFNKWRNEKESYVNYCHPSQVIQRFKSDGLNSLFRDDFSTSNQIHKPNSFSNEEAPIDFLNSAHPEPIKQELKNSFDISCHANKLPRNNNGVNQNGTLPPPE
jgi:hypothetical protein